MIEEIGNALLDGMGSVLAFFFSLIPSYGVAIIGLTVLVRLALFPLTAKQARSQLKMQQAAPEIKRIQQKYKDDRQKQNEEVMKFYKENKINPVAGCLPLLAQMPIFIALFNLLRYPYNHIPTDSKLFEAFCRDTDRQGCKALVDEEGGLRFLGMDLSRAASSSHDGFTDALPYFLLIALVVLSGYLQFKQTQSRQTTQANPQMAMMGKIFPVMFAFISFSLASGIVLYFLVSNIWQIGQQALIYGHILPQDETGAPGAGGTAKPPDKRNGKPADPPPSRSEPKAVSQGGDGTKAAGKGDGTGKNPEGFGRAQPSGSRPRPKRRRR